MTALTGAEKADPGAEGLLQQSLNEALIAPSMKGKARATTKDVARSLAVSHFQR